jgi:hypothetical protein
MNLFVLSILFLFLLFSYENVFAELSVKLDKDIISSIDEPILLEVKLDYMPKDNSAIVQITDPTGYLYLNRFVSTDNNGEFKISFGGRASFPLHGGIWEIKVIGIDNEDTVTDTSFLTINVRQQSIIPTNSTDSQNNGGCLIATATFGSELSPQVQQLREIRDNSILSTEYGTAFMTGFNQFYYSFSPIIADLEREYPIFKEVVKLSITPMLSTLSILNYVEINSEQEMISYGIGIILMNIGMYFIVPLTVIWKIKNYCFTIK